MIIEATKFTWTATPNGKRGYSEMSDLRMDKWYHQIQIKGRETRLFTIVPESNPDKRDQGRYYVCGVDPRIEVFIAND